MPGANKIRRKSHDSSACVGTSCFFRTSGQQKTIQFTFPGGIDRVRFDPSLIEEKELNRVMELSPILGNDNFMIVPENIELCKSQDPKYQGCGGKGYFNLANAQLNLNSISARISKLDPDRYPRELKGVVEYLKRVQSVWLWKEQQKLKFLQTDNIAALEVRNGSIDAGQSCQSIISQIRDSTDPATRSQLR